MEMEEAERKALPEVELDTTAPATPIAGTGESVGRT